MLSRHPDARTSAGATARRSAVATRAYSVTAASLCCLSTVKRAGSGAPKGTARTRNESPTMSAEPECSAGSLGYHTMELRLSHSPYHQ